jgi:hypothetical protein
MSVELTVWCVCVGNKYPNAYVYALRDMVNKYLTIPHEFKCISTRNIDGVTCVLPFVPYQGWWSKFNLFAPHMAQGPSLYFDLDVVITGNINYLADYAAFQFAAPANWARSGHGGIQSSVMAWAGNWTLPYDSIRNEWPGELTSDGYRIFHGKKMWGDQEYLWDLLGDDWVRITGIGSYKYHVQELPDWMKVCVFHGEPKPHEVKVACLLPYISTRLRNIKENIMNGSPPGLSATASF